MTIPVRALFSFQLAVSVSCKRLIRLVQTLENLNLKAHSSISHKATPDKWDGWPSILLQK